MHVFIIKYIEGKSIRKNMQKSDIYKKVNRKLFKLIRIFRALKFVKNDYAK